MSWQPGREGGPLGPYSDAAAVTPNDSVTLPKGVCQAIFATGAGNVAVVLENGTEIVLPIAAGYVGKLELLIRQVKATSTTATGLFALYV